MKQTISVNLNRQVFYLDLDAYEELEKYLQAIKKYFKSESSEVVEDIESRIAEKFTDLIGKSTTAIQLLDVQKIIDEMGSLNDITGQDSSETIKDSSTVKKKLFRNLDTKILAGVASGLATYFGIKPIWIRIVILVFLFTPATTWLVIIGYLAAWFVIPEAKTNWEKLEMQGKPTTVSQLQNITTAVETKTQTIIQKLSSMFFTLIRFCFVWSCRLTGFFVFLSLIIAVVATVVALVILYFTPSFPYFDFSFLRQISSPYLEILFVSLGVITITPMVFAMDIADSLMRWQFSLSIKKFIASLSIWIVAVMLFSVVAKINYPKYSSQMFDSINRVIYLTWIDESNSQTLSVDQLTAIDISSVREVTLTQGPTTSVKIVGSQFAINELTHQYSNGQLTLKGRSEKWFNCHDCLGYVSSVRVEITSPNLTNVKLSENIDAIFYPSQGNVSFNLDNQVGLKVIGKLNNLQATVGTNSVINLLETEINQVDLSLKQSIAKVAAKKITILGDDQSTLIYQGNPQIVTRDQDKSHHQKYQLSEDSRDKLTTVVQNTVVTLSGNKKKIKDFVWSNKIIKQKYADSYNLFTSLKLAPEDTRVYLLWLVEKDGLITLKNVLTIDNWEHVDDLDFDNEKTISITGQISGPEIQNETKKIYINQPLGVLEFKPLPPPEKN
ncbi:MAG TPA: PspC domain-containing protein [Candidatus Woesebacteria bacterium]|nr:PspC domain-containing protein [Candidatus Woesebacteria bacterium]